MADARIEMLATTHDHAVGRDPLPARAGPPVDALSRKSLELLASSSSSSVAPSRPSHGGSNGYWPGRVAVAKGVSDSPSVHVSATAAVAEVKSVAEREGALSLQGKP